MSCTYSYTLEYLNTLLLAQAELVLATMASQVIPTLNLSLPAQKMSLMYRNYCDGKHVASFVYIFASLLVNYFLLMNFTSTSRCGVVVTCLVPLVGASTHVVRETLVLTQALASFFLFFFLLAAVVVWY